MAAVVLFRLPSLVTPIWNVDEAVSACVADAILDGDLPYRDAIDHRGPVSYYLYAFVFALAGRNNMTAIHFALAIMIAAMIWLLYRCGKLSGTPVVGVVAASIFALLMHSFIRSNDLFAFHTEYPLIFFELAAVNFLFAGLTSLHGKHFALSGGCYALAVFSKQPALLDVAGCGLFLLIIMHQMRLEPRQIFRILSWFLGGFLGFSATIIGYFALRGGIQDFWLYVWTYNTDYYIAAIAPMIRVRAALSFWAIPAREFSLLMLFLAVSGLLLLFDALKSPCPLPLLSLCWMATSVISSSLSGRIFDHYRIQALPAISLILAHGLSKFTRLLQQSPLRSSRQNKMAALFVIIGCYLALIHPLSAMRSHFRESVAGEYRLPFLETASYLASHSEPQDELFVWGFLPEIYVMSNRPASSRYIFANVLTGLIPWTNTDKTLDTSASILPGAWEILMRELSAAPPMFLIDTSPGGLRYYDKYPLTKFPHLQQFIQQRYELSYQVFDHNQLMFTVFKRRA